MESYLFRWIFEGVNDCLDAYITTTSTNIIDAISPVALTLFSIYVVMWGFAHITNAIEEPVTDAARRMITIAVVLGLALSVGRYSSYVVDFFGEMPDAIATLMTGSSSPFGSNDIFEYLDETLTKGFSMGKEAWKKAGVTNGYIGFYIIALIFYIVTAAVCAFACFLLLLAKVGLTVLLAIGPIFILLLMFQATKQFFTVWLNQLVNFIMTYILVVGFASLVMAFVVQFMDKAADADSASNIGSAIQMLIMGGLGIVVLRQAPALAQALSGGIGMSTLGTFGATMRGASRVSGANAAGRQARVLGNKGASKFGGYIDKKTGASEKFNNAQAGIKTSVSNAFRRKNTVSGR